jgi:lysozyme
MIEDDVLDDLVVDEGLITYLYYDSLGFATIGIGTCVDQRKGCGITEEEARYLAMNRVRPLVAALGRNLPHFAGYPHPVRRALMNMAYQLGVSGVMKFQHMLAAIEAGDYNLAADEGMKSAWAAQTPGRAKRVTNMIRGAAATT